jgi:hypothetical protein
MAKVMSRSIFTTCNRRHDGGRVYRDLTPDEHSHRINLAIIGSELNPPLSPDEVERRVWTVLYGQAARDGEAIDLHLSPGNRRQPRSVDGAAGRGAGR